MSPWKVAALVTRREVRERIRSKALLASTGITLAVLALVVLVTAATDDGDDRPSFAIGVVGSRADDVAATATDMAGNRAHIEVTEVGGEADARRRVDDLDAVVFDDRIVVADELDPQLAALLQAANREVALAAVLDEMGAGPEQRAAATPRPLAVAEVERGEATDDRVSVATFGTLLLYAQLVGFGYWVASGIVEEKSSRVVEVLLAKARPRPLLAGKVLGIGIVGIAQLVLFLVVGLGVAASTEVAQPPPGTAGVAVGLVGWFVAGYALYASLFAVAGAIASRSEELQGTTAPITIVVMVAFFAAIATSGDAESTVAVVAGYVPFTAPLSMPIRMAAGVVGPAEVALAAVLVALTVLAAMALAARAYAGGALATHSRITLRDALTRAGA